MGWASGYIEKLKRGETRPVSATRQFHVAAHSLRSLCTVEPLASGSSIEVGDIVLCRVRGAEYRHFVKAIQAGRYQIGNNRGGINGWIGVNGVFGKLKSVEP